MTRLVFTEQELTVRVFRARTRRRSAMHCWYGERSSSVRSSPAERIRDRGGAQRLERVEFVAGQQVVDHDEAVGAERFDLISRHYVAYRPALSMNAINCGVVEVGPLEVRRVAPFPVR
jgi:hypothetical protein